jgi:hypothetical protein
MTILMHDPISVNAGIDRRSFPQNINATGDCALFTLPHVVINGQKMVIDERAEINIPFPATLLTGYTGKYTIRLGNAVTGTMTISHGKKQKKTASDCPYSEEAINGIPAESHWEIDAGNHTMLTIQPDNNWLEAGQRFHVFKIALKGYQSYTDKEDNQPPNHATEILFGIQRPC